MSEMCDDFDRLRAMRDEIRGALPRQEIIAVASDFNADLLAALASDINAATMARLKGIDPDLIDRLQLLGLQLLLREVTLVRTEAALHRVSEAIDSV